jgi:hypothetical protein
LLFLFVVVAFWLTLSGLRARSDLNAARADLAHAKTAISQGDIAKARRAVSDAGESAKAARKRTGDVVWRAAAAVPLFGDVASTIRGITREADTLANVSLPTALQADRALDPAKARPTPDRIDLSLLVEARKPLASALQSVQHVGGEVRRLPSVGYAPPVAHARRQLLQQVD